MQLSAVAGSEAGVLQFKSDMLQFRLSLHAQHQQSLQLKVTQLLETPNHWDTDDLATLERLFETKVNPSALTSYSGGNSRVTQAKMKIVFKRGVD